VVQFSAFRRSALYGEGDYLQHVQKLFPRGKIWGLVDRVVGDILQDIIPRGEYLQDAPPGGGVDIVQDTVYTTSSMSTLWGRLLSCFAAELARVELAAWSLWNESVSGLATTSGLLPDWEKMYGLPNHCTLVITDNQEARQRAVFAKQYRENVETSVQFFVQYAADMGFTVALVNAGTIIGPGITPPSVAGIARAGAYRCAGRGVNSTYIVTVSAGSGDLSVLQCIFSDIKPAHVVFHWDDARP